jgi:thymidylate synthase
MSDSFDKQFSDSLNRVLRTGSNSDDRTGVGNKKVVNHSFENKIGSPFGDEYNLPLLRLRKISARIAFEELMWMLRGSTDVKDLQDKNIHIWDGNSSREYLDSIGKHHIKENTIGKAYGYQMRNFNGVDQLKNVFDGLCSNPVGRRHLISFWNPADFKDMALEPCHYSYNFVVENSPVGNVVNLVQTIRSNDVLLGNPTNVVFASFFLAIMAKATGMIAGTVYTNAADFHIYKNHLHHAKILALPDILEMAENYPTQHFVINKDLNTLDDVLSLEYSDIEFTSDKYEYVFNWGRKDLPMAV